MISLTPVLSLILSFRVLSFSVMLRMLLSILPCVAASFSTDVLLAHMFLFRMFLFKKWLLLTRSFPSCIDSLIDFNADLISGC